MKLALASFREKMNEMDIDFIVGGSLALEKLGVPLSREPHDVDLECICTEEQEKLFAMLADSSGNNFYKSIYPSTEKPPYIFKWMGIVFNVWAYREFTHKTFVWSDYMKFAGMESVLRKKMSYRRAKDYQDLNYIIKTLLSL